MDKLNLNDVGEINGVVALVEMVNRMGDLGVLPSGVSLGGSIRDHFVTAWRSMTKEDQAFTMRAHDLWVRGGNDKTHNMLMQTVMNILGVGELVDEIAWHKEDFFQLTVYSRETLSVCERLRYGHQMTEFPQDIERDKQPEVAGYLFNAASCLSAVATEHSLCVSTWTKETAEVLMLASVTAFDRAKVLKEANSD